MKEKRDMWYVFVNNIFANAIIEACSKNDDIAIFTNVFEIWAIRFT